MMTFIYVCAACEHCVSICMYLGPWDDLGACCCPDSSVKGVDSTTPGLFAVAWRVEGLEGGGVVDKGAFYGFVWCGLFGGAPSWTHVDVCCHCLLWLCTHGLHIMCVSG